MKGLFITGTDTGIGKTVVSTILALKSNAFYWKPIQAGLEPETDSEFVEKWIEKERILPESYRLKNPLSPNQAAFLEGIEIKLATISIPTNRPLIVEGAGGVYVPLNQQQTMLDLMKKVGFPLVVVARSGLGTLNHTLLTLEAIRNRGLRVHGLVLVGPEHQKNKETLLQFGKVPILAEIPWASCPLDLKWFQSMAKKFETI